MTNVRESKLVDAFKEDLEKGSLNVIKQVLHSLVQADNMNAFALLWVDHRTPKKHMKLLK